MRGEEVKMVKEDKDIEGWIAESLDSLTDPLFFLLRVWHPFQEEEETLHRLVYLKHEILENYKRKSMPGGGEKI